MGAVKPWDKAALRDSGLGVESLVLKHLNEQHYPRWPMD
jgi:hypothetical protein